MKKLITFFSVLLFACTMTFAQNLAKGSVTIENLADMVDGDYDRVTIDDDGELRIEEDGYKVFVRQNEKSAYLNFYTQWGASENISEARAIRLINKWNSEKVFTIACYTNNLFVLDYYLTYAGGINSSNFNDTIVWIFFMAEKFGEYLAQEDAL